jgi:hypothetical protein
MAKIMVLKTSNESLFVSLDESSAINIKEKSEKS